MRGARHFRYGARVTITAPLAAVFVAVAAEMALLASAASTYWRIGFVVVGTLAILLAIAMIREVVVRLRGKRVITVAARELVMPELTLSFRDIKSMELRGYRSFQRTLVITHANGTLEISGVMLGSVGELDEIHGLIKAARKR